VSIDGKLLSRAKSALESRRRDTERAAELRRAAVYAKCPGIAPLEAELRATVLAFIGAALKRGGDAETAEELQARNLALQGAIEDELERAGFPRAFLDDDPACDLCGDTGYRAGAPCDCLLELYREEQRSSLSGLLKLGDETFDSFDLSYYDDAPDARTGVSPRRNMEIVYETCVQYARKFGKRSFNLFLCGAPGLGKTFLSACIARVVSENGHSVVYDTVAAIFSKLEDEKFGKGEDAPDTREQARRYRACDLLIIDDLGTEMTTAFTVSALYELINTRLITGKKTVISSNLTLDDLRKRYTPQIMSRVEGEYQALMFYGEDIRLQKRRQ
jgi:DNA replication protein DnaC